MGDTLEERAWWRMSESDRQAYARAKLGPGVSPREAAMRFGLPAIAADPPTHVSIAPVRRRPGLRP